VILQPRTDCGMGQVPFAVQFLLTGTALLVIKVDMLTLDPFKLVYLCVECVYVSYNAGVP